jgi:radical SAM protein (TIGR01212 family)
VADQVASGINFLSKRYKTDKFVVYFQAYSNTYAPLRRLKILYEQALSHPGVIGLAIGTRPDCIDAEKIEYLEMLARDYYITLEYGLESPYDKTLKWINREHDFQSWVDAVNMTAGRGIHICSHIILGFPTENRREMLKTASILSQYPIDYLKIHHLHVVKKTVLAKRYRENPFHLFEYSEYVNLVVNFLQYLRPNIKIQRLAGETHPRMLIGPQWNFRTGTVQNDIAYELEKSDVWQGKLYNSG